MTAGVEGVHSPRGGIEAITSRDESSPRPPPPDRPSVGSGALLPGPRSLQTLFHRLEVPQSAVSQSPQASAG